MGSGFLSKLKSANIDAATALRGIVRGNRQVTSYGDIGTDDDDSGLSVGRPTDTPPFVCFGLAAIVATGPDGAADFTDSRYWIKWLVPAEGSMADPLTLGTAPIYDPPIACAANLAEMPINGTPGGTHATPAGTIVYVFAFEGSAGDRFAFSTSPVPQRIHIDSPNGYGGGIYKAYRVNPPTSALVVGTSLTAAALGAAGTEIVAANTAEIGTTGHWLTDAGNTNQKDFEATYLGVASNGLPAYRFFGAWFAPC